MKIYFYITLAVLMFILTGCPKDNPLPADPCAGSHPTSASFKAFESITNESSYQWINYDTDTSLSDAMTFIADDSMAISYEWHIGSEVMNTRSVYRRQFPSNQVIPITLIIRKLPNLQCFPNDDGIDTVTRNIYFGSWDSKTCFHPEIISGTYQGYNINDSNNIFLLTIINCSYDSLKPDHRNYRFINLTPNGDISDWDFCYGGYKELIFANGYFYKSFTPRGILLIKGKNNDSIEINYNVQISTEMNDFSKRIDKKFIGKRVK